MTTLGLVGRKFRDEKVNHPRTDCFTVQREGLGVKGVDILHPYLWIECPINTPNLFLLYTTCTLCFMDERL